MEAKFILVGTESYECLREAMGTRFNRSNGNFETYQFISIVLDPLRTNTVCVLPGPGESNSKVRLQKIPASS